LTVHSDGKGLGARFSLTLPLRLKQEKEEQGSLYAAA
jgi:hypothetical protein